MTTATSTTRMRIIALGLAVIILSATLAYRFMSHADVAADVATNPDATATSTPSINIDTDGDGVPDWEEQMFGTNPNDPKSVPTPNVISAITGDASTSMTTALAHTLMQQYLANTNGGSADLKDPAALGAAIANSVAIPTPTYHVYKVSDIKTLSNTAANRAAYQTQMANALAPMNHTGDAEITLYTKAIGGDKAATVQLQTLGDTYGVALDAAAHLSVPSEAVLIHVNALNALSYYTATLRDLLTHTDDPVGSLVLLRAYNDSEQQVFTSFAALQNYITAQKTTTP